jgi:hypothetical protein
MFPMRPEYFQVRTQDGTLHLFDRNSIIRVEITGWPSFLERRRPNKQYLNTSEVVGELRVVVAMIAAGYVNLEGAAAMSFLRQFYRGTHVDGEEQPEPEPETETE